jgi:two-component system sensor histidine kinase/response regulator
VTNQVNNEKQVSCRVTSSVIKYLESLNYDTGSLLDGIPYSMEYLCDSGNWVTYEIREALFERAAALSQNDAVMFDIGLSLTKLTPLVSLFTGPKTAYNIIPRYAGLFDNSLQFRVTFNGQNKACVELTLNVDCPWSKGTCYYARGILSSIPTVFGLPAAHIHEKQCMCRPDKVSAGDSVQYGARACVYEVEWQSLPSWKARLRDNFFHHSPVHPDIKKLERNLWLLNQKNTGLVERNKQLALVRDISVNIDKVRTINEALSLAVEQSREIDGVRFAIVLKIDESRSYVSAPYHSKINNRHLVNALQAIGFDPDKEFGLDSSDKILHIPLSKLKSVQDYLVNPRVTVWDSIAKLANGAWPKVLCDAIQKLLDVKKMVLIPLLVDGSLWGSMLFFLTREVPVDILEMIDAHCALAIKNVTSLTNLEKRNKELSIINSIINITSATLDQSEMLQNAIREVTTALDADAGAIFLPANGGKELYLAAHTGMPENMSKNTQMTRSVNSPFYQFVLSDEPFICGDMLDFALDFPDGTLSHGKANSVPYATAQLRIREESCGLITVARKDRSPFDSSETSILVSVAKQLAIAIEKASLSEDVIIKTEETEKAKLSTLASEAKSRLIIESVAEGVTVTDLEGIIQGANRQILAMHGFSTEKEMLGLSFFLLLVEKDRPRAMKDFHRTLDTGSSGLLKYTCLKRDGSKFPGEINISLIKDVNGRPTGFVATSRNVTERQQSEQALTESEEKYRSIFESANDVIVVLGRKANIIDVNDRIKDMAGYDKSELIGQDFRKLTKIMTKKSLAILAINYAKRLAGINVPPYEVDFLKNTGEVLNTEVKAAPLKINDKIVGDIAIFRDITQQKRSLQAVKESEEKFAKAFHVSPDACSISSLEDGRYIEINNSFTKITGYAKEEIIGSTARKLNLWADASEGERIRPLLRKRGSVTGEEITFRTKSGEIRRGIYSAEIVKLSGQNCVLVTITDITDRKRMETALRESEEKFSRAFTSSAVSICICKLADQKFIEVNESFTRFTGYSREEALGRTATELGLWADSKELAEFRYKIENGGGFQNLEIHSRMKSGEIRVGLASVETINIGGEPCRLMAITDITERKQMEDELRKAMARADAANQAKSDFLARMSHEIRTPIHGVMGTLDLLRETELGQEQCQYVNMARASADILLNVINQVLDFSRIEVGKIKLENADFNLRTKAEEALSTVAILAHRKGLEAMLEVSRRVPAIVNGDAARLQQVLVNLLGNAIKFTEKGEIVLRVGVETTTGADIELHFSVSDTGIGIPPEKRDLLFHPFEQVDGSNSRRYGGSGLGLSICKQLVTMMNGRIWFDSSPGTGSVFHFTAKFGKQAGSELPDNAPQVPRGLHGMRILVVDDNATYRSILRETLSAYGFQVAEAPDIEAAFKELESARGTSSEFRIVLLDKTLPTTDVFAASRTILHDPSSRPALVMMLASDNIAEDFASCRNSGISRYLVKPVKESDLINVILAALGQESVDAKESRPPAPADLNAPVPLLRILVAEDNVTSQLIVKTKLEKVGHTVRMAANGREAVRMAKEGVYDLILMDFEMPEMNGLEATRLIREMERTSGKHIPIIAMTAYAMKEDKEKCLEAGMDAYLSKPVKLDELHKTVNEISAELYPETYVLDIKKGLELVEGDENTLKEVVRIFLKEDYPEQLQRLKVGISAGDTQAARIAAHGIKGAARSFGSASLAGAALQLEEMGKKNDFTGAPEALQKLEAEARRLADFFTRYSQEVALKDKG